jgi:predicted ATPase/class 3 adenylate cyclase
LHAAGTTILFTDIEGSTRLWEQDAQRMSRALAGHDAAARAAVERHRGVVVKMLGDGMYAAFDDPADGVEATIQLQRALGDPAATAGVPLRVRCALHRGVVERRGDDYFGTPVNRAARIMSAAHGGQILLSQAVVERLAAHLPQGVTLRDLGNVRLKDLSEPEHVWQLEHPELRRDFPALRSLESAPNNLPQQITTFVGREREIAEAKQLLAQSRLVTLLGMGGLGKTRLSLQIAADELDACPDGAWFVDLAPIRDPSLVPSVCASVLGVQEEPGTPLVRTLSAHLRAHACLVILDNCEHLVAACADLAHALLRSTTRLRILATSREPLHVPGEQTYAVLPLAAPDKSASVGEIAASDAVRLFVDRARLHQPSFVLNESEAPAVAELCARLDGIPLALELAAARIRSLPVAEINARLRDRFKLLTGGGRVLLPRQQTLRALVDWSYDLLNDDERVLFDRLCVFAGGFDLASCEEVCGVPPLATDAVLDLVASLVDKSLVIADEGTQGARYRTLETIREYARERLAQRGELDAMAVRHCERFLTMAKAANQGIKGPQQADWLRRNEAEIGNLRAAIALTLGGGADPVLSVKFEVALLGFWLLRGYATEGREYVRASLALPAVRAFDLAQAHALYVGAALAQAQSDLAEAERQLEACLALRRTIGDKREIAATLSTLSLVRLHSGDTRRAREGEQEALRMFGELGERIGEAIGHLHLAQVCAWDGDDAAARRELALCMAIAHEIQHGEILCECDRTLGEIELEAGNVGEARERFTASLERGEGTEDKRDAAIASWCLGRAELAEGRDDGARAHLVAALNALHAFEMTAELLGCLEDIARLLVEAGEGDEAVRIAGAVDAHRQRLRLVRAPRGEARWRGLVARLRGTIADEAFDACWREGAGWRLEEAVGRARRSTAPAVAA